MKLVREKNTKAELFCFNVIYSRCQKADIKVMARSNREARELVGGMKETHEVFKVHKIKRY